MNTPKVTTNSEYNLNTLPSDRRFEMLLHRIFEYRIKDDLQDIYDEAFLMSGGSEKGTDVRLMLKGKNKGIIQAKMNTSGNLNKPNVAKEIIKFSLHVYLDKTLIDDIRTFQYYFICSGKFSMTAITLLGDFKNNILKEKDFKNWTSAVLKEYVAFKDLTYKTVELELKKILGNLNVKAKSYSEINGWLNNYNNIVEEFFEIKKVIDSKDVKDGIKDILNVINPNLEKKSKSYISSYYKSAKSNLNTVKFIGHAISFNRPRNITVSQLYVEPYLKLNTSNKPNNRGVNNNKAIKINDIFKRSKHYVLLGDPGAGKSLMVKNLILKFMKNTMLTGGLKNYKSNIPFRIELRKYGVEKIKNNVNIINYLSSLLEMEYQLPNNKELLVHIIENKKTLFFFDGLDEVFDISQKNSIRDDIVNFISVYKNVKCIVTSRFVGYQNNSFPNDKFDEFSIQGFNDKQINKFIEKFYATQISNKTDRLQESLNCERQLESVDIELKSNPLILSLMSLLAINKIIIPESKLDVYRSCTNTLVETRDKDEKQLKFDTKVKSIRGTFGKLGYWQYCQMTEDNKINRILAKKSISDYLIEKNEFDDSIDAEEASEYFLTYAENRSIYFDDVFMHKTFLEYYTADYIFSRYHNTFKHRERDEIIKKYITNQSWHIVFELLVAMIDEQIVDTEILDNLITTQLNIKEANYFFLSILSKTNNISKNIQKEIINNVIDILIEDKVVNFGKKGLFAELQKISQNKNFYSLMQSILLERENSLKTEDEEINFYIFYYELNYYFEKKEQQLTYSISNLNKLETLKQKNIILFIFVYLENIDDVDELKKSLIMQKRYFGIDSIFQDHSFIHHPNITRISLFNVYLNHSQFDSIKILKEHIEYFEKNKLSINQIKKYYKNEYHRYHRGEKDSVRNLIIAYIESNSDIVRSFIKIIFPNINNKEFNDIKVEFNDNEKFIELIE